MDTEVERRVRAAFAALADTVDTTEPTRRGKRWYVPVLAAAAAVIVIAVAVLATPTTPPQAPSATQTSSSPPPPPPAVPYDLYTHCGIDEARLGDTYYEAETPMGNGSAPPGWDNPYQRGTMTVLSPTTAVFRDNAGHEVRFRVRPGATSFKQLCD